MQIAADELDQKVYSQVIQTLEGPPPVFQCCEKNRPSAPHNLH